ncbi:hypothetical protein PAXRUDRAFT_157749 [Paxillus rubicundulus Ve08.2h10]|uniref:Uncharacterized protein n=1 Tax=Paxillus rubicundulus Ve08.2h10 TaxID=930991 RepID=A0A0D0DH94_9AGAM|nr:hypothetical protein PAXRUDRAFT_157749 [Paxillus rubicundulus Ve08.2h10]
MHCPSEPSLDKINYFLHPLVNCLPAWKDGTWFTRAVDHLQGRLSWSVRECKTHLTSHVQPVLATEIRHQQLQLGVVVMMNI